MAAKKKNWLPFEEARRIVRDECIPSFSAWKTWHDREKPAQIPKRPERVYDEWEGWNDWLGNDNKFTAKNVKWMSYEEAILFVHPLELTSREGWLEYCRGDRPDLPEKPNNLPTRPEITYKDSWVSWKHFFGSRAAERVEARKQAASAAALVVVHMHGHPNNCFVFKRMKRGVSQLDEIPDLAKRMYVVRKFRLRQDFDLNRVLTANGCAMWDRDGEADEFICPNIHQVLWDIMSELDIIK